MVLSALENEPKTVSEIMKKSNAILVKDDERIGFEEVLKVLGYFVGKRKVQFIKEDSFVKYAKS